MKRKISITMGLSLVAVFAIIATLGLFSLNQANPVEAQAATPVTITADGVTLTPPTEDDSTMLVVIFAGQELSQADEDKIFITLDSDFQIDSSRLLPRADRVTIGTDNPPSAVSVDGSMITLEVGGTTAISSPITVTFPSSGAIKNPAMGGRYSVKVSTTKDEKVATYDADAEADGDQGIFVGPDTVDDLAVMTTSGVARERTGLTVTFETERDLPTGDVINITLPSDFTIADGEATDATGTPAATDDDSMASGVTVNRQDVNNVNVAVYNGTTASGLPVIRLIPLAPPSR